MPVPQSRHHAVPLPAAPPAVRTATRQAVPMTAEERASRVAPPPPPVRRPAVRQAVPREPELATTGGDPRAPRFVPGIAGPASIAPVADPAGEPTPIPRRPPLRATDPTAAGSDGTGEVLRDVAGLTLVVAGERLRAGVAAVTPVAARTADRAGAAAGRARAALGRGATAARAATPGLRPLAASIAAEVVALAEMALETDRYRFPRILTAAGTAGALAALGTLLARGPAPALIAGLLIVAILVASSFVGTAALTRREGRIRVPDRAAPALAMVRRVPPFHVALGVAVVITHLAGGAPAVVAGVLLTGLAAVATAVAMLRRRAPQMAATDPLPKRSAVR